MIEPFDAKRHEALVTTGPLQPLYPGHTVHRLITPGTRRAARCGDPEAILASADWRLVSCTDCRADAPGAWYDFGTPPPAWLVDGEAASA
ncbi:MAG TPA: hypothetical protein VGL02_12360 [Streptomyces sp.]